MIVLSEKNASQAKQHKRPSMPVTGTICGHRGYLDNSIIGPPFINSLSLHNNDTQDKENDAHWSRSKVSSQAM